MPPKTIIATALAFAINFTAQTTSISAQAASHESQQTSTPDPSELLPAPSTWRGAFTDSLRLLLVEHTTRVAFQGKTRRELSGNFFGDYKRSLRIPDTGRRRQLGCELRGAPYPRRRVRIHLAGSRRRQSRSEIGVLERVLGQPRARDRMGCGVQRPV